MQRWSRQNFRKVIPADDEINVEQRPRLQRRAWYLAYTADELWDIERYRYMQRRLEISNVSKNKAVTWRMQNT